MKHLKPSILALSLIAASSVQANVDTLDFNDDMTLGGDAYTLQSHVYNGVILTPNETWQKGSAFTNLAYENISKFTAKFEMKLGNNKCCNEADGLTFAWVTDPSANTSGGGNLGFTGMTGYAVEFDTYTNSWDNGSGNHVAVIQDSVQNKLVQAEITDFNLSDGQYRSVEIEFDNGIISVDIDGDNYINEFKIDNYAAFDGYFGFTAATGGQRDWHKVRNFELTGVSPVPEPSTYALMLGGLGLVGFMAYRRRKTA